MVCEIAKLTRFLSRLATGIFLLTLLGCGKSETAHQANMGVPLHLAASSSADKSTSVVSIDYPPPGEADPLDLRGCALSGIYGKMPCRLIGTKGSIRKITWMDDARNTAEASTEFDRTGKLQRICRRGHVDFQGWNCAVGPFSNRAPLAQTKLDDHGRIVQQQHDQFDPRKLDICTYNDEIRPKSSECRVESFLIDFTFDEAGRALTYSRHRIPVDGEPADRKAYLDKAYALDLTFTYKNDALGNWTTFDVTGKDPISGAQELFDHQTLVIDYY